MKKILVLIIVLLLGISARAEGNGVHPYHTVDALREQVNESWHAVYDTPWRTVEIDVWPTIPSVRAMPILKVRPAFWIPEAFPEAAWVSKAAYDQAECDTFTLSRGEIYKEEQVNDTISQSEYFYAPLDAQRSYAPGNQLTMERMLAQLDEILSGMENLSGGLDTSHIFSVNVTSCIDQKTGETVLPARMTIQLATTLRTIPLWGHVIMSVDTRKDHELFYDPKCYFTMRSGSSYMLMGSTVKEVEEIAADIPLCGFDQVVSALEEEIMAGHIRSIYSIDLGLALYNEPGVTRQSGRDWIRTAEFYAVPTWRCACIYTKVAKQALPDDTLDDPEPSMYYKTLYVNAQTGELFSPTDDHDGCADYQGFISWEEVR